ncbi:MAG: mannose-6-phosphate isomerase, class I [Eubacteriales bacterium]|nr:mannose-6-phosphate isomerase, class I [Eubacteriales bacterium]
MLYPFKLKPVYKDYIWGGRALERFRNDLPEGIIAESWEISCHPQGISIVDNGIYKGTSLPDLIALLGRKIIGTKLPDRDIERFPLLVKLIDASDKLSVQVHPDDKYADEHENGEFGKNEAWYIIDAKPGAELIFDTVPGVTRERFAAALERSTLDECHDRVTVQPGDVINIPSGVVHAIGSGIILAEIQQSSNATYRVYDYDRIGKDGQKRPLHVQKALDVIDFANSGRRKIHPGLKIDYCGGSRTIAVANKFFAIELFESNEVLEDDTNLERFHILMFFSGSGELEYESGILECGNGSLEVKAGESILVPASLGKYKIKGKLSGLKAYVPDIKKCILRPLLKEGYTFQDIRVSIGGMEDWRAKEEDVK